MCLPSLPGKQSFSQQIELKFRSAGTGGKKTIPRKILGAKERSDTRRRIELGIQTAWEASALTHLVALVSSVESEKANG